MNGSDYIKVFDGLFNDLLCEELTGLYQEYPEYTSPGRTAGGVNKVKKSLDLFLHRPSEFDERSQRILQDTRDSIDRAKSQYVDLFPHMNIGLHADLPKVQKYVKGIGNYGTHIDTGVRTAGRQVVVIAYLNDVDEGGETVFPMQDVSVEPVKGRVVVFPPTWQFPHEAMKPVSGDKVIATAFYYSMELSHGRS